MATRVYVGNLDPELSSAEVRQVFEAAGHPPGEVILVRDPVTGRRRGFGYVELPDDRIAAEAMDTLDGAPVHGRALSVRPAGKRPPTRFVNER